MSIPKNNEGVTPPDDPNRLTPAETAAKGVELQQQAEEDQLASDVAMRRKIAILHRPICAVAGSDDHWLASAPRWQSRYPTVKIQPEKRVLTASQLLYGPDKRKEKPDGKPQKDTFKLAHRRSYVHLALMREGVPVDMVEEYLEKIHSPEQLIEETKRWLAGGANAATPTVTPGVAVGETLTGQRIVVKVAEAANDVMASDSSTPRPLNAVKQPSAGEGPAVIEILGEAAPEPAKPQSKPNLPPGHVRIFVQGTVPNLKKLVRDFRGGQWARTEGGERLFLLPEVEANADHAGTNTRGGADTGGAGGGGASKPAAPAARPASKPVVPARRALLMGTEGVPRGTVDQVGKGPGTRVNTVPQPLTLPQRKMPDTAAAKGPVRTDRPAFTRQTR